MPLTVCIECNNPVSDSASKCPTCASFEPFGVNCELCGERMRRSTGVTSKRQERTVYRGDRFSDGRFYWHARGKVERDIVAHRECVERFYTPPATSVCRDCGLELSSTSLGFTAVGLWSGTVSDAWDCPKCGAFDYLHLARCKWAPDDDSDCFQTHLGAYPCMRPLYQFQTEAVHGHGQHSEQEAVEVEHEKEAAANVESERKAHEKFRNEQRKAATAEWGFIGTVNGGLLGFVVGFFQGCSVETMSLDINTLLVTIFVCACIGGLIGSMIGRN